MATRYQYRRRKGGNRRTKKHLVKKGRKKYSRSGRKYTRARKHKYLSLQTIKTFFPDIALSKLKGHHIWTGIPCNDLSSALSFGQGGTNDNTITIRMNGNPLGGRFYYQPGTSIGNQDILNPVNTYLSRYTKYRPMGCKVVVTVFSQDEGLNPATTGNTQVATPFMLYGFPCVFQTDGAETTLANNWAGTPAQNFTADTIPQMKYGFRRISPGLGGKNMIKYTTYWDFAKITGLTNVQYMAHDTMTCNPDDSTVDPTVPIMLVLALADYTPALARQCTVDIKITQYGRWEGQEIKFQ